MSSDRGGTVGKGDAFRGSQVAFRKGPYWWRSGCCNAKVKAVDDRGPKGESFACVECGCFCFLKDD